MARRAHRLTILAGRGIAAAVVRAAIVAALHAAAASAIASRHRATAWHLRRPISNAQSLGRAALATPKQRRLAGRSWRSSEARKKLLEVSGAYLYIHRRILVFRTGFAALSSSPKSSYNTTAGEQRRENAPGSYKIAIALRLLVNTSMRCQWGSPSVASDVRPKCVDNLDDLYLWRAPKLVGRRKIRHRRHRLVSRRQRKTRAILHADVCILFLSLSENGLQNGMW